MTDQPHNETAEQPARRDPSPEVLAELTRLNDLARQEPNEISHQIALWTAVARLNYWVFVNRGTAEAPRPYMLAAEHGHMLAVYSNAADAVAGARANGLAANDETVPLLAVPVPQALDWAMSFGPHGVVAVVLDYPFKGAWCPLPNLAHVRPKA